MLPQATVVCEVFLYLTWVLSFEETPGFSLGRFHMGEICPPHLGTSAGGQSITGGMALMRGTYTLLAGGGPTLIDYIASEKYCYCQAAMQFICYDSIKTCCFISYSF